MDKGIITIWTKWTEEKTEQAVSISMSMDKILMSVDSPWTKNVCPY